MFSEFKFEFRDLDAPASSSVGLHVYLNMF